MQDFRARDVTGHQVRRELDAVKVERQALGQRADHEGLGQAGHPLEHAMAAGEDADHQLLDDLVLPDDDAGNLFA